jgi:intein/homing endonuclease
MSEKSNLFNRLTKLFRSGPVIKRNVRNITAQRGSTAVEVFKKAHSDVYNATLSAYGAFDRMCLDLDTRIAMPGKEKFLTMRELMELYPNGEQFVVYAFDHETKSIVPAWAHHPRSSGVRKTVKITFDDGSFLVCTPDHPCMLRDGTFKDAGDLEIGQSMARCGSQKGEFCHLNVFSVESWLEIETGDLTVDGYENFATDTIIVHNSRYSDFAEMESCIAGDTPIAVPDGYVTIKELANKYGPEDVFIVYSYDHSKQQIVPAYGKQARKTATAETVKITFDSGKVLVCTPDHRVMRRDGTYCEAAELQPGDSMMPFYRRNLFSKTREENDDHYRWIYTMNREESKVKNGWIAEHKLIAEWAAGRKMLPNEEVHHVNFVRYDNRPENLLIMDGKEHRAYHSQFLNAKKWSDDNKEWINKFRANHSQFMQNNNPAERKDITFELILNLCDRYGFNLFDLQRRLDCSLTPIYNRLESNGFSNFEKFAKAYDPNWRNNGHNNERGKNPRYDKNLTFIDVANSYKEGITQQQLADALNTTPMKINYRLKHEGYKTWTEFKENFVNHKVMSVEKHETIDLYDLTVDGYKNYATDSIIVHNTPEICSALDIYAEETVSPDEHGKVLHVYSDNRKVHELLTHLFYDVLNVEFNLVMWVRNLVKYGDFFLFNDINPEYGVINAYPISISEIEREEGYDPNDPAAVRFRWVTQGNQLLENWQISHFRLLGNDAFLPYGSSVLEGARRIWRQLILIEDAMLVYRVIRAPERRVFYIDVGNVPPEEVANYLEQVQTSLKRNQIVDRKTGKVDLRYNPLSVEEDFFLPVRGGESGTKIDTLAGGQNTAAIEDVQYIQNKLFAALKIPKAYIGYDADIGSKATLSQEDIRFSRTIQRIQKTVVSELNKIAQIHLYCHGYDGEDLADFELHLSNPSTVAQMQKLELIRTRFEIAGAAPEGAVNRTWIQKNVLGLTDAEIEEVHTGRITDKKRDLELEGVTADGGDEGGGEGGDAGGDEGGGLDDLLGGGDEGGGEDLTAGDAKAGDLIVGLPISPSASVQTKRTHNYYGEADEPIDIGSLSILDANAPLKADAAIRSSSFNEERNAFGEEQPKKKVRKKGRRMRTSMPDLLGMVNHERSRDSLKDPFGRTTEPAKVIDESSFTPPRVTFDLVRTLSKMSNVMGIAKKHNALLTESEGEGDPDGEA